MKRLVRDVIFSHSVCCLHVGTSFGLEMEWFILGFFELALIMLHKQYRGCIMFMCWTGYSANYDERQICCSKGTGKIC